MPRHRERSRPSSETWPSLTTRRRSEPSLSTWSRSLSSGPTGARTANTCARPGLWTVMTCAACLKLPPVRTIHGRGAMPDTFSGSWTTLRCRIRVISGRPGWRHPKSKHWWHSPAGGSDLAVARPRPQRHSSPRTGSPDLRTPGHPSTGRPRLREVRPWMTVGRMRPTVNCPRPRAEWPGRGNRAS